jgi:central kinetochore subunit Mal2/MCM21
LHQTVLDLSKKQLEHNQECLYRTCAGITTFKVQDPDPFAVDKGRVLGIRIEAFTNGKFIRPYYVFLNKPYKGSQIMRVHRHTVPPCIPLAALAAKYLPTPDTGSDDVLKARKQDLPRFVRCLRREIASYHNRVAAIAGMRKAFGLDVKKGRNKGKGRELIIRDISAADAEAKQIRFEWVDGRIGRAVVDGKGEIQKCVIIGEDGRDRDMERRILGGNRTIDEVAERMGMGIQI